MTRHPPRPRPAASPLTERSAARRRRRASRAATLALALTRSAQAERASLAQTEQRPRQRSLLRPPDARAAAAAAVAASSLSLPPPAPPRMPLALTRALCSGRARVCHRRSSDRASGRCSAPPSRAPRARCHRRRRRRRRPLLAVFPTLPSVARAPRAARPRPHPRPRSPGGARAAQQRHFYRKQQTGRPAQPLTMYSRDTPKPPASLTRHLQAAPSRTQVTRTCAPARKSSPHLPSPDAHLGLVSALSEGPRGDVVEAVSRTLRP